MSENLELRDQAYADYRQGMKYKEIAEKYGVSLSAVKSWAARYWKAKKGCNQNDKKLQPKKKKVATSGAPLGNKNAIGNKGGAAPKGNKNAVTTGEFETLFFDCLDPEEKELAAVVPQDKEQLLLQEIQLLTIRERRMLKRIENLRQVEGTSETASRYGIAVPPGMTVTGHKAGIEKGKITDLEEHKGTLGQIQNIEDALTRVQARKQAAIDSLHRYGVDDAKLEIELMRLDLQALKLGGQETEIEDDGFLEALNAEAGDLWSDADDSEQN